MYFSRFAMLLVILCLVVISFGQAQEPVDLVTKADSLFAENQVGAADSVARIALHLLQESDTLYAHSLHLLMLCADEMADFAHRKIRLVDGRLL